MTATPTQAPAAIAGLGWLDQNGDGLRTGEEPPLAGITVTLYSTATVTAAGAPLGNTAVLTTVTGSDGRYRFSPVAAATYFLRFAGPAMLVPTQCNQGSDEAEDSDACQRGLTPVGQSASFTVAANPSTVERDAGFTQPVTVSGYAYLDQNRNEQRDANEPAMSGVVLILQEAGPVAGIRANVTFAPSTSRGGREIGRTVTGSDGSYAFTPLVPGRYQLLIAPPSGFLVPGSPVQLLPPLAPGQSLNEVAGLVALQPTMLDGEPEPTHQLYLPLIQLH